MEIQKIFFNNNNHRKKQINTENIPAIKIITEKIRLMQKTFKESG